MCPTIVEAKTELKNIFGLNEFRPHQTKIIQAILDNKDVLAILPTGGGKSLCFQVPALLLPGLTLVITPLISLMVNQVAALRRQNVAAEAWHSQLSSQEEKSLLKNISTHQLKLLYLSPEKLLSNKCQEILKNQAISLVVLDEVHCLALWGFNFRPSYLKISDWLKSMLNRPKIVALTATATPEVVAVIISQLSLKIPFIYQQSSIRKNIFPSVIHRQTPAAKLASIFSLCQQQPTNTILIYGATRVEVEWLFDQFTLYQPDQRKILKYHGGMSANDRSQSLKLFLETPENIMLATNAFGMGIDKPNIRLVIHSQLPSNLENFTQEIGRASRDGQPAKTVLIVSDFDWKIQLNLSQTQPQHLRKMLWLKHFCLTKNCLTQTLASYFNESSPSCQNCQNCRSIKFKPSKIIWQKYLNLIQLKIPYRRNLKLIAFSQLKTLTELNKLPGIGPLWSRRWGKQVLKILAV